MRWVNYLVKGFLAVVQLFKSLSEAKDIVRGHGSKDEKVEAVHAEFQKVADRMSLIVEDTETEIDDAILTGLREALHAVAELVVGKALQQLTGELP